MKSKRPWIVLGLIACTAVLIWSPWGHGQTSRPAKEDVHFYFVQITDTHLGESDNAERTAAAVKAVNSLPMHIEFVAHTGDIFIDPVEDAKAVEQGMSLFRALKPPVHFLPGNHDIPRGGKNLASSVKAYQDQVGPLSHKAECKGVVLLFFYDEPLRGGFTVKGYDPLGWLEESLKEAQGKPVIVFCHAPSSTDFYNNILHSGWPREVDERWRALLARYNVKAVIAGHFHRDELHWLGDVPLFVSTPVASLFNRQPSYRIYEYDNGRISYTTQYLFERGRLTATSAPAR
jgi:3',5'-cyclic AMP phosphodiesterase CpdA